MKRATISKHILANGESHLDIFFETETDALATYETETSNWNLLEEGFAVFCSKKQEHRYVYLDYEGEISHNRGQIGIIWRGFHFYKSYFPHEIFLQKRGYEKILEIIIGQERGNLKLHENFVL
jgi:hypothetical protein